MGKIQAPKYPSFCKLVLSVQTVAVGSEAWQISNS